MSQQEATASIRSRRSSHITARLPQPVMSGDKIRVKVYRAYSPTDDAMFVTDNLSNAYRRRDDDTVWDAVAFMSGELTVTATALGVIGIEVNVNP